MKRTEVKLVLTGDSANLIKALQKGGVKIQGFARRTKSIGQRIKRNLSGFRGLAAAFGLYRAGKAVIDLETRLGRLAAQANLPLKKAFALKQELFDIAKITHQKPGDLLAGIEAIVERTGDYAAAHKALKDMGIIATTSGAPMEAIGATTSNLFEKMGIKPAGLLELFDILLAQGKKGAFTLQNMSTLFERLLSAANRIGVQGVDGIRRFGAFLQFARRGTGTSEEAATAVERSISNIIAKAGQLEEAFPGIVFDVDEKTGIEKFRAIDLILKDIIIKTAALGTKKQGIVLQKIFGERGIRAITPLVMSFKKFGDFREFDKFLKYGGDTKAILGDFAKISSLTASTLTDAETELTKMADKNLSGPIKLLNEALKEVNKTLGDISKNSFWDKWGGATSFATTIAAILAGVPALPALGLGAATYYGVPKFQQEFKKGNIRVPFTSGMPLNFGISPTGKAEIANLLKNMGFQININIDDERVRTETNNMNAQVKTKRNRGEF